MVTRAPQVGQNYALCNCEIKHNQHSMLRTLQIDSLWARIVAGLFFCLSGAFISLLLSVGASPFWYILCAVLWALSGVVWFFRPSIASALSTFPVLGVAVWCVQVVPHFREQGMAVRLSLLFVVVALGLVVISFQWSGTQQWVAIAISLVLVLIAFGVDRLWTNKVAVHEYSMNWSANGAAPWGHVETNEQGESPVVTYRRVDGGYCYDAIFSPELREKLAQSNKPTISVEYNVFSDFGRRRAYNIRAVDGMVFNDGDRNVRSGESYGGYIEVDASRSVDCGR